MYNPPFCRVQSGQEGGLFLQTFYKICLCLMIIGGINWGLIGLFQCSSSLWSRIVFTLVGAAALCGIPGLFTNTAED